VDRSIPTARAAITQRAGATRPTAYADRRAFAPRTTWAADQTGWTGFSRARLHSAGASPEKGTLPSFERRVRTTGADHGASKRRETRAERIRLPVAWAATLVRMMCVAAHSVESRSARTAARCIRGSGRDVRAATRARPEIGGILSLRSRSDARALGAWTLSFPSCMCARAHPTGRCSMDGAADFDVHSARARCSAYLNRPNSTRYRPTER
jgi:hypothetical protein